MILLTLIAISTSAHAFEIIAHRGVHQTYSRGGLTNDTCTAVRMERTGHEFLENTLPSIREAFRLGATMVEVDIHPTADGRMVVFHDWTVDCRTEARCDRGCKCAPDGTCVTHDQTLEFLKKLDLGYGCTADGGRSFPFRGKFVGQMPTLEEALELLEEFPDRKFLVNVKDKFDRTQEGFLRIIENYPPRIRERVHFQFFPKYREAFAKLGVPEAPYQAGPTRQCYQRMLLLGWFGYIPEACRGLKVFVPLHTTLERVNPRLPRIKISSLLAGWPEKFIERMKAHGSRVYVAEVDSAEDYEAVRRLPLDGVMTDKIEIIGPRSASAAK